MAHPVEIYVEWQKKHFSINQGQKSEDLRLVNILS